CGMIRHTVVFTLKHAVGSLKEKAFFRDARVLGEIPGVRNFEQLRQISPKNTYEFAFSMEFEDRAAYDGYNAHPKHVAFVRDHWNHEVESFAEFDYEPLSAGAPGG